MFPGTVVNELTPTLILLPKLPMLSVVTAVRNASPVYSPVVLQYELVQMICFIVVWRRDYVPSSRSSRVVFLLKSVFCKSHIQVICQLWSCTDVIWSINNVGRVSHARKGKPFVNSQQPIHNTRKAVATGLNIGRLVCVRVELSWVGSIVFLQSCASGRVALLVHGLPRNRWQELDQEMYTVKFYYSYERV